MYRFLCSDTECILAAKVTERLLILTHFPCFLEIREQYLKNMSYLGINLMPKFTCLYQNILNYSLILNFGGEKFTVEYALFSAKTQFPHGSEKTDDLL